jgi:hypothetical protein
MSATESQLKAAGVDTLAVVATTPENAKLYVKFRPTKLRLASDPELTTHRAYGIPKPAVTPEFIKAVETIRINRNGDLPEPRPVLEVAATLAKADGYVENPTDTTDKERHFPQVKGQFLIDRDGIVRWANIECLNEGVAGVGKFPSPEEILAAARALSVPSRS